MNIIYYENPYLKECDTEVIYSECVEGKNYIRLNDVLFYAKGGGQKADRGTIEYGETANVLACIKDEEGMPLVVTDKAIPVSTKVECHLDFDFRYTQMRLHTSLHLLHCFIEDYYKKAIEYPLSSNIETDFAYNKYPEGIINDDVIKHVNECFIRYIKEDHEVVTYPEKDNPQYRYWKCLDYTIPCGGIHVKSLKELGLINIEYHTKKGVTTVKVRLG